MRKTGRPNPPFSWNSSPRLPETKDDKPWSNTTGVIFFEILYPDLLGAI